MTWHLINIKNKHTCTTEHKTYINKMTRDVCHLWFPVSVSLFPERRTNEDNWLHILTVSYKRVTYVSLHPSDSWIRLPLPDAHLWFSDMGHSHTRESRPTSCATVLYSARSLFSAPASRWTSKLSLGVTSGQYHSFVSALTNTTSLI